jgi:hypothetical protein
MMGPNSSPSAASLSSIFAALQKTEDVQCELFAKAAKNPGGVSESVGFDRQPRQSRG